MEKFFGFAFFSSPTSIDMCGKTSGQVCSELWPAKLQYILLWAWPSDDVYSGTLRVTSIAIVCFWAAEK